MTVATVFATTAIPSQMSNKKRNTPDNAHSAVAGFDFAVPTRLNILAATDSSSTASSVTAAPSSASTATNASKRRKVDALGGYSRVVSDASEPSSAASALTRKNNAKWMSMLEALKTYKVQHGDCIVPRGYTYNPKLASWVAEQRKQYKLMRDGRPSNITQERVDLLNEVGFTWNAQEAAWNRHFEDLKKYKAQSGDCLVPMNCEQFPQLGLWVKEQRRHYAILKKQVAAGKSHQSSHMTLDRVKNLEAIGFCWDSHDAIWWERFRELKEYNAKYGDCLVPTKYPENPALGTWVHHQRRVYKRSAVLNKPMDSSADNSDGEQGGTSASSKNGMSADRLAALNKLGFVWSPRGADTRNRAASPPLTTSMNTRSAAAASSKVISENDGGNNDDGDMKMEDCDASAIFEGSSDAEQAIIAPGKTGEEEAAPSPDVTHSLNSVFDHRRVSLSSQESSQHEEANKSSSMGSAGPSNHRGSIRTSRLRGSLRFSRRASELLATATMIELPDDDEALDEFLMRRNSLMVDDAAVAEETFNNFFSDDHVEGMEKLARGSIAAVNPDLPFSSTAMSRVAAAAAAVAATDAGEDDDDR